MDTFSALLECKRALCINFYAHRGHHKAQSVCPRLLGDLGGIIKDTLIMQDSLKDFLAETDKMNCYYYSIIGIVTSL